jgi:hypothetical protein
MQVHQILKQNYLDFNSLRVKQRTLSECWKKDHNVRLEVFNAVTMRNAVKNAVHTSQETHYISATDPSLLMLCKIWGFHGGDHED